MFGSKPLPIHWFYSTFYWQENMTNLKSYLDCSFHWLTSAFSTPPSPLHQIAWVTFPFLSSPLSSSFQNRPLCFPLTLLQPLTGRGPSADSQQPTLGPTTSGPSYFFGGWREDQGKVTWHMHKHTHTHTTLYKQTWD